MKSTGTNEKSSVGSADATPALQQLKIKKFQEFEISSEESTPLKSRVSSYTSRKPSSVKSDVVPNNVYSAIPEPPSSIVTGPSVPEPSRDPKPTQAYHSLNTKASYAGIQADENTSSNHTHLVNHESIYQRSKHQIAASSKRLEQIRCSLEEKEVEECTFRPKISKRAKALSRSPSAVVKTADKYRECLRKNFPDKDIEECTFNPQICNRSAAIVCQTRSRHGNDVSVVDRLYEKKRVRATPSLGEKKVVRTPQQIQQHLLSMYEYEERKREFLKTVREVQNQANDQLFVDPNEVVERLYQPRISIDPDSVYEEVHPEELQHKSFRKKQQEFYLHSQKNRKIMKWFRHFSGGKDELSLSDLDNYSEQDSTTRAAVKATLEQETPAKKTWTESDFTQIFLEEKENSFSLWKVSVPSAKTNCMLYPFHPTVNRVSKVLAERKQDKKFSSANDRLYFAAMDLQLKKRQLELEREQEKLKEEEQSEIKRCKLLESWRRASRVALMKKASQKPEDGEAEVKDEEVESHSPDPIAVSESSTSSHTQSESVEKGFLQASQSVVECSTGKTMPMTAIEVHAESKAIENKETSAKVEPSRYTDEKTARAIDDLKRVLFDCSASLDMSNSTSTMCDSDESPVSSSEERNAEAEQGAPAETFEHSVKVVEKCTDEKRDYQSNDRRKEKSNFLTECSLLYGIRSPAVRPQNQLENKKRLHELGRALYRRSRVSK